MSKKIVVITGSPRNNGNTFAMTEAFIKAAEAKTAGRLEMHETAGVCSGAFMQILRSNCRQFQVLQAF